jgi:AraC-like DNA-binding protein
LGQPFESLNDGEWRTQPHCFLAGQLTGPLFLRAAGPSRILGVRLRPGGAGQLLGMPVEELTDQVVAAGDLGLQPLARCATLSEVEDALLGLERGSADELVDEAARLLARTPHVGAVAALLGVSSRQLERRFKARVGMSPKYFARIRRFQRVFPAIEEGGEWVDAAAACGYYDQAEGKLSVRVGAGPETVLEPGGFAFLPAKEVQRMSCVSNTRCTFYIHWDGKLDNHRVQ